MPRTAISAPSLLAAEAGAAACIGGGNAVDAAVAATIAGMISEPGIVGPGAGCLITIWEEGSEPVVIDGYVAMPGAAKRPADGVFGSPVDMTYGGGMTTRIGAGSVAVPGAWDALGQAVTRFGAASWRQVMSPAFRLAERGYPLSEAAARYLEHAFLPIFSIDPEMRALLTDGDGRLLQAGEIVTPVGLAETLETIAGEGARTWYEGAIAEKILAIMDLQDGCIGEADLVGYRAEYRTAVRVEVGEWVVATSPAPSIGAPLMAATLLLLDSDRQESAGLYTTDIINALATVQGHRDIRIDHAHDQAAVAMELLREVAIAGRAGLGSSSTIHVSAADDEGRACAITTSAGYGSGVMIPNTGLALNNCLGEIDLYPAGVSGYSPGDRLGSNMAPTVARRGSRTLALGSPGAARIVSSMAQVLAKVTLRGDDVEAAIEAPRLHVEPGPQRLLSVEEPLEVDPTAGFVVRRFPAHSMYFGAVGVAGFDPEGSGLTALADRRRSGDVAIGEG